MENIVTSTSVLGNSLLAQRILVLANDRIGPRLQQPRHCSVGCGGELSQSTNLLMYGCVNIPIPNCDLQIRVWLKHPDTKQLPQQGGWSLERSRCCSSPQGYSWGLSGTSQRKELPDHIQTCHRSYIPSCCVGILWDPWKWAAESLECLGLPPRPNPRWTEHNRRCTDKNSCVWTAVDCIHSPEGCRGSPWCTLRSFSS